MMDKVQQKFGGYPDDIADTLRGIRAIILDVASSENLGIVEETLKWGEPSYLVKGGSPIRLDWKSKVPNQYGVYFNCKTLLVETFKEIYGDTFEYEGNRALVFNLDTVVPERELRHCISMAFRYHKLKRIPLLGA